MFRFLTSEQAKHYSTLIVYLANGVFLVTLFGLRAERISNADVQYFSLQFLLLVVSALGLVIASLLTVRSQRFHNFLARIGHVCRVAILIIFVISSFVLVGTVTLALPFMKNYAAPFVAWLILTSLGLSFIVVGGRIDQGSANGAPVQSGVPTWFKQRGPLIRVLRSTLIIGTTTLLMLELGLRFWFTGFGTENDRVMYVYSWDEIRNRDWLFRGLPFVNYALSPSYPGINSLGYRGPEITIPKPDGVFRIVAMGGSTTYGDQIMDSRDTYPAQLETILKNEDGYTQVEVVNAGVPSYTSWEILVNFEFRILDLQPDMVIFYEAINDLAPRVFEPSRYQGLSPAAGLWLTNPPPLSPSVLYRFIGINLGWTIAPNNLNFAFEPQYTDCCAFLNDDLAAQRIAMNPPIYYERNIRNLVALAKANHIRVLLSTWTYFPDATSATGFNSMTKLYRQQAIAEHNAIVQKIAEAEDEPFYDLYATFPYNRELWTADGVHMNALGTHEQAAAYAAFLIEQRLLPPTR